MTVTPTICALLVLAKSTALSLQESFAYQGFILHSVSDPSAAMPAFQRLSPQLILLDYRLGIASVQQLCAQLRRSSPVPMLVLSATPGTDQIIKALECGADDCLSYPLDQQELLLRIHAVLRRSGHARVSNNDFAGLKLFPEERRVTVHGAEVTLTTREFDLLTLFTKRPRMVLSRQRIAEIIWGDNWIGDERLIDSHVCRLRDKLTQAGLEPCPLVTVRGVGYVFRPVAAPITSLPGEMGVK